MSFCLPKFAADAFKAKVKSGEITPEKLLDMTSDERRSLFSKFLGEDVAKKVNASLEAKLLLKNQQQGILNWAKKLVGIPPEVRRDIIARVERMTEILQPAEEKAFLADLTEQRLGASVTPAEASHIAELAKEVATAKHAMENEGGDRLAYGKARVEFGHYISDLKNSANSLSLKERIQPGNLGQNISDLGGTAKSLKASFDNSAIFRQGWKTLFTHPQDWLRNSLKTFSDFAGQVKGNEVMDAVQADIQSRPTYDLMKKAGLDTGTTEEAFPNHAIEKFPGLGRLYKASEAAYTGFVYRQRADIFDKYLQIAKTAGLDITDKKELQSIGKLVNSLTGRGDLGVVGERAASAVNNVFFSPRFLKSNIDFLTAHQFQKGVTPFVRKQAAKNLVKVITGSAAILGIANAVKPGSVELDPRSSDFGKIKIGDTRFDVSGGMASVLTLAARLLTLSTKSTNTHKVTPLNSGKFGAQTGTDVIYNFAEGKLSPEASIVKDILKGQDFNGNKPTPLNEAINLLAPLPITNTVELYQDPKSAGVLAGTIADALGISANTYGPPKKK